MREHGDVARRECQRRRQHGQDQQETAGHPHQPLVPIETGPEREEEHRVIDRSGGNPEQHPRERGATIRHDGPHQQSGRQRVIDASDVLRRGKEQQVQTCRRDPRADSAEVEVPDHQQPHNHGQVR
ncbi:MAG: hypothetical protein R3C10_00910 [Pirellulales bacterium]